MTNRTPNLVVVHPIVLLSVVDHFNRLQTDKRVVGTLLGYVDAGRIEITNSFAVPFEEDMDDPKIWFLDHNYHERLWAMFKKVNANERPIGWYSTGPKIRESDLEINEVFRKYTPNPIFVIVDVQPEQVGIPTKAYVSVKEVTEEGRTEYRFQHIPSIIGALEAEEVGVEHLLRDVKDTNISTLSNQVSDKIHGLRNLKNRLQEIVDYIDNLVYERMPINNHIVYMIQDIFNLLPNLNDPELIRAFIFKTNDMMLNVYVASLFRSITALHDLINNKLEFSQQEARMDDTTGTQENKEDAKKEENKVEKEKETGNG